MNKKIKELARKAGLEDQVTPFDEFENLELQAFAELVIWECISTCERLQDDLDRQNWPTPYECAKAIKEHFGIAKE